MQKNEKPMDIAEVLARRKPQLIAKRAMDILLSACALAVLWPLLLLIALAVVIDDPGPVFYRQVRIGRDGKPFRIFKIRSISSNTTSALLSGKDVGAVNMNRRRQSEISQKYVNDFRTKIVSLDDQIGSLSGGNQQKVVIARALSTQPKVVILDEPTRGIDAAARGDVYNIIRQLKDAGVAVLMVSSDMEEVVELADRAITVFQGRINGEFSREEITQDALTSASFGIAHERKV